MNARRSLSQTEDYNIAKCLQKLTVDFKGSNITIGSLEDDFRLSKELDDDPSSNGSSDMGAAVACAGEAANGHKIVFSYKTQKKGIDPSKLYAYT